MILSSWRIALTFALLLTGDAMAAHPPATPLIEGEQQPQSAVSPDDYRYLLFVPKGYQDLPSQQWPLVIFLHGRGERDTDIERIKAHGPPRIIADHPGLPAILASPQLDPEDVWDTNRLDRLLAHLRRMLRVDPNRIYLTGLSLGGHAAWAWAAARPELFAAVAPVAGRGDPAVACQLKDMPIWAFHGDNDDVVPPSGSFAMVEAVRECKGSVAPRLTIYPATNHDSWVLAYDDPALYRWLLEQRRAVPTP